MVNEDAALLNRPVTHMTPPHFSAAVYNGSEIARMFNLDPSTIQYFKQRLGMKILEYMGPDILVEIRRRPGWKNNLNANRERLACRVDRRN